jgi:hypothetical protein
MKVLNTHEIALIALNIMSIIFMSTYLFVLNKIKLELTIDCSYFMNFNKMSRIIN